MAEVGFALGLIAGSQVGFGTVNATIQGATGALGIANGVVLGDASSGVGESGIDLAFVRVSRELAPVSGSFTKQFPTFLRRDLDRFTIAVQLKGSGPIASSGLASNPVVDGDMDLSANYPGLHALFRALGLSGAAWGGGVGYSYMPASVLPATVKVWDGAGANATAYVIQDCVVADFSIKFAPGDVAVATFEIAGTVLSHATETFPTFTYGHLATISAPTLVSAAHSYGIGAVARDFSELELTINTNVEQFSASNSPTGFRPRQTRRDIGATVTLLADTGDPDYEDARMIATGASADDLTFNCGAAAVALGEVKGFAVFLNNPSVARHEIAKVGDAKALTLTLEATGTTVNSEFELRFI